MISIEEETLREMVRDGLSKQEIAGRFVLELQDNYPNQVAKMNATSAAIFMQGVKAYSDILKAKATEAIEEADKRTSEALAAEETAITSEGLSDAISYWTSKQTIHEKQTRATFRTFCAVLVAGLALLFWGPTITGWLTGAPSSVAAQVPTAAPADTAKTLIEHLRGFILPTLAIAWLLRLISRQYITHLALQEDARLRGVLVRTFLALQRNTDADIDEKERAHMLEAIFRPLPTTPTNDVNQPSFADIAKGVK